MMEVPYPFVPSPKLLEIPVETETGTVGFIGRVEKRKGVVDLASAIPAIIQKISGHEIYFCRQTR